MKNTSSNHKFIICLFPLWLLVGCAPAIQVNEIPATPEPAAKMTTVHGTVLGHDGQPIPIAHVRGGDSWLAVSSDGTYSIDLPQNRLVSLKFRGLMHASYTVSVLTTEDDIPLAVQLSTYKLAESPKKVELVVMEKSRDESGALLGYQESKRIPMTQNKNGQWSAEAPVTGGELIYEIAGVRKNAKNTMVGSVASSFVHDDTSGYLSALKSTGTKQTVVFDPTKVPTSDKSASMTFAHNETASAQIAALHREMKDYSSKFWKARRASKNGEAKKKKSSEEKRSVYQWQTRIQKRLDRPGAINPHLRHALLLSYFNLPSYFLEDEGGPTKLTPSLWMEELVNTMKPSSPLWGFSSSTNRMIGESVSAAFFDDIAKQTQDPEIAAQIAFRNLQSAATYKFKEQQKRYFEKLETTLAKTPTGKRFQKKKERYQPDHPFKKGKPVPTFSLASFEKPEVKISPKQYMGSHLLIEVWGTWCGPCIADMGKLHDIHKELSPKGLKMLSIAVFDEEEKVTKHRQEWPMPWDHAVLDQEGSDRLMGIFQAMGVPSYILVGPDGNVLEKGFAWRSNMKEILRDYLVKNDSAPSSEK
ncbi:MAG: TlpA family protein disulfide reductase [Deltaproteobacteria bacterium]|nr:TlpA family protein disulfide reductase [Deltaproteobacteria bacterium]